MSDFLTRRIVAVGAVPPPIGRSAFAAASLTAISIKASSLPMEPALMPKSTSTVQEGAARRCGQRLLFVTGSIGQANETPVAPTVRATGVLLVLSARPERSLSGLGSLVMPGVLTGGVARATRKRRTRCCGHLLVAPCASPRFSATCLGAGGGRGCCSV